jgi:hypothetical protein
MSSAAAAVTNDVNEVMGLFVQSDKNPENVDKFYQ